MDEVAVEGVEGASTRHEDGHLVIVSGNNHVVQHKPHRPHERGDDEEIPVRDATGQEDSVKTWASTRPDVESRRLEEYRGRRRPGNGGRSYPTFPIQRPKNCERGNSRHSRYRRNRMPEPHARRE